jgi:hypothetical protein
MLLGYGRDMSPPDVEWALSGNDISKGKSIEYSDESFQHHSTSLNDIRQYKRGISSRRLRSDGAANDMISIGISRPEEGFDITEDCMQVREASSRPLNQNRRSKRQGKGKGKEHSVTTPDMKNIR